MATANQSFHRNEYNKFCSPCKRKGSDKFAAKYCENCSDYYCVDCVIAHNNFPALSGHKLLNVNELKKNVRDVIPVVPTERCERHNFKIVDMYCQNHDTVGCNTCMVVDHRLCQDVIYVSEYIVDHDPLVQCENVQEKMQAVSGDIGKQLDIRQQEIERLCKRKEEDVRKIKQFRIDIVRKIDEMERKSVDAIEVAYNDLIKMLEDEISTLSGFQTNIHSLIENIRSFSSNVSQLFVDMKISNTVIENANETVKEKALCFKIYDVVFKYKKEFVIIDKMDTFGEILEMPYSCKLEKKRKINVKHESDSKTCNIISSCMQHDGSIIIADRLNQMLKRLDGSSFKIVEVCKLPGYPWQICRIDEEIAVSFGNKNIKIISSDGTLNMVRELKTYHGCYGLGYMKGRIYVTDSMVSVFVYSKAGTQLSQYSEDYSRQKLFSNIFSLTVSHDGEKIYVADNDNGLVVLSKDGKLERKYKPSIPIRLRGICETKYGNIFVCDESSNSILQFSQTGDFIGEILQDDGGAGGCKSVCFDHNTSRLIVGRESRDYIEVYKMI